MTETKDVKLDQAGRKKLPANFYIGQSDRLVSYKELGRLVALLSPENITNILDTLYGKAMREELFAIYLQENKKKAVDVQEIVRNLPGLLRWYVENAEKNGDSLAGKCLAYANLTDHKFAEGANLSGVDLRNATLEGATALGVNFKDADLQGTILRGANLLTARLIDANLSYSDCQNAHMDLADLRGANFENANCQNVGVNGADFAGAKLAGTKLTDTDLSTASERKDTIFKGRGNYSKHCTGNPSETFINLLGKEYIPQSFFALAKRSYVDVVGHFLTRIKQTDYKQQDVTALMSDLLLTIKTSGKKWPLDKDGHLYKMMQFVLAYDPKIQNPEQVMQTMLDKASKPGTLSLQFNNLTGYTDKPLERGQKDGVPDNAISAAVENVIRMVDFKVEDEIKKAEGQAEYLIQDQAMIRPFSELLRSLNLDHPEVTAVVLIKNQSGDGYTLSCRAHPNVGSIKIALDKDGHVNQAALQLINLSASNTLRITGFFKQPPGDAISYDFRDRAAKAKDEMARRPSQPEIKAEPRYEFRLSFADQKQPISGKPGEVESTGDSKAKGVAQSFSDLIGQITPLAGVKDVKVNKRVSFSQEQVPQQYALFRKAVDELNNFFGYKKGNPDFLEIKQVDYSLLSTGQKSFFCVFKGGQIGPGSAEPEHYRGREITLMMSPDNQVVSCTFARQLDKASIQAISSAFGVTQGNVEKKVDFVKCSISQLQQAVKTSREAVVPEKTTEGYSRR